MLVNKEFFDFIFPPEEVILKKPNISYDSNNVQFKNIAVYGAQGEGKTSCLNYIAQKATRKYGRNNVNAVIVRFNHWQKLIYAKKELIFKLSSIK